MRVTRIVAGVVGLICLSFGGGTAAADPAERLAREFPRLAVAVAAPVPQSDAIRSSMRARFHEPVVLEGRSQRVVLRALDAAPVARQAETNAYPRAFRGVDVLRANGRETLLADSRAALEGVAYNIASMSGVSMVVPYGRAMRFVASTPGAPQADLTLSAPVVVGADGRVSQSARWVVVNAGTPMATLRLQLDDPLVRYPAAIAWAPVTASAAHAATRIAPREIVTNGTGTIAGSVTDAATGSPMPFTTVDIYYSTGEYYDGPVTDENGNYVARGLDTGSYRALVSMFDYQPQMYDGISCGPCDPTAGTAISVVDGQQTGGIDFALERYTSTTISGHVRDTGGNPLPGVGVAFYDAAGQPAGFADSNDSGAYTAALAAGGTYYARTINNRYTGYVDQLYTGIDCTACVVTSGTPINLPAGGAVTNIDFSLKSNGGKITGSVTDAGSGAPLSTATLLVYNSAGRLATFGYANESGVYTSWHGLAAGSYYAVARADTYDSEIYSETPCASTGCDPLTGTAIPVTLGSTASNIDFTLGGISGRIRGTVTDAVTGGALGGVYVYVYDASGKLIVAAESSYEDGSYEIVLSEGGTYYARTFNFVHQGYADELYQDLPCTRCDVTTGTPIAVSGGSATSGIDFTLSQTGGWITGRVLDTSNAAVANSYVIIYGSDGSTVTYGIPDSDGNYTAFNRLDAGTYYAVASAERHDSQLYSGISCANGCTPTDGTAIEVTAGQTTGGVDFFLAATGCGAVGISPETLPNGNHNESYSQQLTATNTSGAVTFALIDGELPPGLTLSSSGLISGTLTTVGTYRFAIQVADANDCSGARGYTIEVAGMPTSVSLTVDPNPAQYGHPITFTANVSPSAAEGTVNFSVDGTHVGSATVVDGVAQISATVGLGTHEAFASYSGGGAYGGSVSDIVTFTVEKGTPVLAWDAPAPIVYGTALSATQLDAVVVVDNEDPDATISGTFTYDPPAGTILDAGTHTLSVTFTPQDTDRYNTATATVTLVVEKASQSIDWATPANIVYGTPLGAAQLNATVTVAGPAAAGALTYDPAAGTILDAGTHTLTVTAAETTNYTAATASVGLIVEKASQTIVWADPADIVYGTPLGANELDATVSVVGPAPAGALTYTPAAGTLLNAGTHTLSVAAAETNNYHAASASVTLVVLKATPVFSNLSSPTIVIGTTSVSIGGTLSFGAFVPTGSVSVTLNGVTQSAALGADGSFATTFNTASLAVVQAGHTVSFSYAGDANFNAATATSTLVVTYGVAGGPNPPNPSNAGATIPMRITLRNAAGANLSSASIAVTAYGIRPAAGGAWTPVSGAFNYTNAQGGSYMYNLKTPKTLTAGVYEFGFTVANDPVIHTVTFTIR